MNGQLEFYFVGPVEASRVFGITPDTGSIYPRISLRDVSQDQWVFTVGVRDKGIPQLSAEAQVTANIQRVGKPVFPDARYDVTEFESAPVNKSIIPVVASDQLAGVSIVQRTAPIAIVIIFQYLLQILLSTIDIKNHHHEITQMIFLFCSYFLRRAHWCMKLEVMD